MRKDGIYIDNARVPRAVENNKLRLIFSKGKADNPIIQGIIVYNKPIAGILLSYTTLESPQAEYLKLKRDWANQSEMRKARK